LICAGPGEAQPRRVSCHKPGVRRQERFIICTFLILQTLDGTMTYAGVRLLGPHVEMNGVLAWYMDAIGVGLALALAKLVACACGCVLYTTRSHRTLAVLSGVYLGVAIVPWLVALIGF
jgi:hypothetical protein